MACGGQFTEPLCHQHDDDALPSLADGPGAAPDHCVAAQVEGADSSAPTGAAPHPPTAAQGLVLPPPAAKKGLLLHPPAAHRN